MVRLFVYMLLWMALTTRMVCAYENVCDVAATQISDQSGVPLAVLLAVARVETGRNRDGELTPWPWTANVAGKGYWFGTRKQAETFILKTKLSGLRSFDVGCFQLNYHWHGRAFASLSDMLDPKKNASYAAGFLNDLYQEFGSWELAVGAYHSRTEKYAERYKTRFRRMLAGVLQADLTSKLAVATSIRSSKGSLTPLSNRVASAQSSSLWR